MLALLVLVTGCTATTAGTPSAAGLNCARPAATAAAAARLPFSIGVETDDPEVAGGPAATFGDNTAAALEAQTALVRSAFGGTRGYSGVTVEHLLSWQALLAR